MTAAIILWLIFVAGIIIFITVERYKNKGGKSEADFQNSPVQCNLPTVPDKVGNLPVYEQGLYYLRKNNTLAVKYLTEAAESGDEKAIEKLYEVYYYGITGGTPPIVCDREKAIEIILPFAEKGSVFAQKAMGDYYYYRRSDNDTALEWYLKAADGGNREAMYQAAELYFFNENGEERKKWLLKAAEQNYADAEFALAGICECSEPPDYKGAVGWYTRAFEHGESDAAAYIGEIYMRGNGVARDEAAGFQWFKKASDNDSVYGTYLVGKCYFDGTGVPQDKVKAIELYTEAAEYDYDAQFALAMCYIDGDGVKKNVKKGVKLLEQSAEDNDNAQSKLAEIYYAGNIVKQDKQRAYELWKKASEQGNCDAVNCLKIYFYETVD